MCPINVYKSTLHVYLFIIWVYISKCSVAEVLRAQHYLNPIKIWTKLHLGKMCTRVDDWLFIGFGQGPPVKLVVQNFGMSAFHEYP